MRFMKDGLFYNVNSRRLIDGIDLSLSHNEFLKLTWLVSSVYCSNLAQNYLTGPLSPRIGNLTRMQYL